MLSSLQVRRQITTFMFHEDADLYRPVLFWIFYSRLNSESHDVSRHRTRCFVEPVGSNVICFSVKGKDTYYATCTFPLLIARRIYALRVLACFFRIVTSQIYCGILRENDYSLWSGRRIIREVKLWSMGYRNDQ